MRNAMKAFAVAAACLLPAGAAWADECDIELGKKQFRKCRACHKLDDGKNVIGPHLFGIVDRDVAGVSGFKYSTAMKEYGSGDEVWDTARLERYLTKPKTEVPGTKMVFAGFKKEDQRAAVICYLATNK